MQLSVEIIISNGFEKNTCLKPPTRSDSALAISSFPVSFYRTCYLLEFGSKWGVFYWKNWVLGLIVDKFFGHKHVPSSLPRITSESCLFAVKPHCPGFFAAFVQVKWPSTSCQENQLTYTLIGHKYPPQKKSQSQKSWATSTRPSLAASMLNWNFFRLTSPGCFGWSVWHIKNIS